ncbi:MAG TPA: hypothetical protein VFN96_02010, partial [Gemmatimonadales bacterium]|nr:hypothetical protein [Gemmatimonadales bacterium]
EAITKTGLAVGTPQYMSPEQATGAKDVDARTDLYALGAVLYEMLAGEPPFTGRSPQAVVARALTETPRPLASARQGLPAGLEAVVTRALAKRPVDRQATAAVLAEELAGVEHTARSGAHAAVGQSGSRTVGRSDGGGGGAVWVGAGAIALLALVAVAFFAGRWGLPAWSLWLAGGLGVAGAVMLWLTSGAEKRRVSGSTARRLDHLLTWRNTALGGIAALVVWSGASGVAAARRPAGAARAEAGTRLAVLPFANLGDAADAYFADGIADEVRGKLSRVNGLTVTASTSTGQYRETAKSPQEIARELGVDYLLVGRVRWAGGEGSRRVQVTPEVIDARTGAVTWQQAYDADLTDVFQVQGDIATRVAAAIGLALGRSEQQALAERPTANLAAYDAYLKGQAVVGNDPARLRQSAEYFEQAVRLDSSFVQAWARLSRTLSILYNNGTPSPEIAARALAAAERALAIAPDAPDGHVSRATYYLVVGKNPLLAHEEIQAALRLAPNDGALLPQAGGVASSLGRWDEALAHYRQAWRLDPRSVRTASGLQTTLLWMRQYREALEMSEAALALAPGDLSITQDRAMVYVAQGDLAGARGAIRQVSPTVSPAELVAFFGNYWDMYWVLPDSLQRLLVTLKPSHFDDDPSAWANVLVQTWWFLGDRTRARAYADTALTAQEAVLADSPNNAQRLAFKALAFAYAGKKSEAIATGEQVVRNHPIEKDHINGPYFVLLMARIYHLTGENEKALDQLERLLQIPFYVSAGWLRIDPEFAGLKGNPRFDRLIAQ